LVVPPGPCATWGAVSCVDHQCLVTYKPGDALSQEYGSCTHNFCDVHGKMTAQEDDTNVFQNDNPCNPFTCVAGLSVQNTKEQGAPCQQGNNLPGFCEPDPYSGLLACEPCNPNMQNTCPQLDTVCIKGQCVATHCTNKVQDVDETDVDCGGSCLPCIVDQKCSVYTDCTSLDCSGGVCIPPTCMDKIQNGTETGRDCGGGACPPCDPTLGCAVPGDCKQKVCKPKALGEGDVCMPALCTDGVQNGMETGIDCGGPMCPPCATM
jgi:hypothetical protein